jgi:hypothetical protein
MQPKIVKSGKNQREKAAKISHRIILWTPVPPARIPRGKANNNEQYSRSARQPQTGLCIKW